jgi:hypothetical protein
MSEEPKRATSNLVFKLKLSRCDRADELCDKSGTPGDMECLICVLGKIREELAEINENMEASQP